MTELHPTRRTIVRTAAWSVPAVTIATAAPAFAASPPSCMTAAEPVIWQNITVTVYTRTRTFASIAGVTNRTDGVSKLSYTFKVPQFVRAGAAVLAQAASSTSTLGQADAKAAYDAGGRSIVKGWVDTNFAWGAGLMPSTQTVRMTLKPTGITIPTNSQLVTSFVGTLPAFTAGTVPGEYVMSFVNPTFEPVEGNGATWNGSQTAKSNFFGIEGTASVHSMIPPIVPTSRLPNFDSPLLPTNEWGTQGQAQSLIIGTYKVLPAC